MTGTRCYYRTWAAAFGIVAGFNFAAAAWHISEGRLWLAAGIPVAVGICCAWNALFHLRRARAISASPR